MGGSELEKWKPMLKAVKFFEEFTDDNLAEMVKICSIIKYSATEFIFHEGDDADSLFIILKGTAKITKKGKNPIPIKISSVSVGACFGEIAILFKQHRSASVIADGEVFAFKIKSDDIDKLSAEPKWKLYREFAKNLAVELKKTDARFGI